MLHAVTSAHPKTRYLVGNVDGWPALAHYLGAHLLPDRLLDRLILRVRRALEHASILTRASHAC